MTLDVIVKPHRKVLDLKATDSAVYVADHTAKSVIVSCCETSLLNFDPGVKIEPRVEGYG